MIKERQASFSLYTRVIIWLFGYDYFISYSHSDSGDYVHQLHRRLLQSHLGFVDSSDEGLFVGSDLRRTVPKALRRSKVLIVVYTPSVAEKHWTRLESRFFATVHPKRPFIPVSSACDNDTLQRQAEVLFDSDESHLAETLNAWFGAKSALLPVPTSSTITPLWAIEEGVQDLSCAVPSDQVVRRIRQAFYGTSVPRKGLSLVASLILVTIFSLTLGWYQLADRRADGILAELTSQFGKAHLREVQDDSESEFSLVADIDERQLIDVVLPQRVGVDEKFRKLMQDLRQYDFYRRWGSYALKYRGLAVALYSVPDSVLAPPKSFPSSFKELRITSEYLGQDWMEMLQQLDHCELLALNVEEVSSSEALVNALNELCVTQLRIRNCRTIGLDTFEQLSPKGCSSLQELTLSMLNDLLIESVEDEKRFSMFLMQCKNLKLLRMREMPGCHITNTFGQAISRHPSLAGVGGEIELDEAMVSPSFQVIGAGTVVVTREIADIGTN